MALCLDLLSSFCAGWRFAEQGEPPASPGAHLQGAHYGHQHLQQIHLQQHCIHQPTIFVMHCNCHYHHHQLDNPHYQGYNQNILLQKLQFQLAFLAAELEGIIREIFNEDVRGEKQWLGIVTFTMLTTSIALMMMKSWHFLVIKGGDLKDRLSYLEEELLFKLEVFNHTSQTFLSTSPPCTTQGAEQRARVGDGPHQDGH